jgi:hypothetical protein
MCGFGIGYPNVGAAMGISGKHGEIHIQGLVVLIHGPEQFGFTG